VREESTNNVADPLNIRRKKKITGESVNHRRGGEKVDHSPKKGLERPRGRTACRQKGFVSTTSLMVGLSHYNFQRGRKKIREGGQKHSLQESRANAQFGTRNGLKEAESPAAGEGMGPSQPVARKVTIAPQGRWKKGVNHPKKRQPRK